MKIFYTILIALLITTLTACQKDVNPYITKAQVDKIDSLRHPALNNIAFIYHNDVYLINDFSAKPVQVTKTGSPKRFIKMAHDHSKFAYMKGNQIEIVDIHGNVMHTTETFSDIKGFGWSADDKTLYIINGDSYKFYGPVMQIPAVVFFSGYNNLIAASVSDKGDLAYILMKYNFDSVNQYEMVIRPANGAKDIIYRPDELGMPAMSYVSFSNGQDLALGFAGSYLSDNVSNVYLFDNLGPYPSHKLGFNAISTPAYHSNVKYLLGGVDDDNKQHLLTATYLDDDVKDNNKILAGYPGVTYVDWR